MDPKSLHEGNETYLQYKRYLAGSESGKNEVCGTKKESVFQKSDILVHILVGRITIKPGNYEYTYNCMLPPKLPSSIESPIGHIRYIVSVVLDEPRGFTKAFKKQFTIINPLNLIDNPIWRVSYFAKVIALKIYFQALIGSFQEPIQAESRKSINLGSLFSIVRLERLVLSARLSAGGYIPRQRIKVEFSANNKSNVNVTSLKAQLIRVK